MIFKKIPNCRLSYLPGYLIPGCIRACFTLKRVTQERQELLPFSAGKTPLNSSVKPPVTGRGSVWDKEAFCPSFWHWAMAETDRGQRK